MYTLTTEFLKGPHCSPAFRKELESLLKNAAKPGEITPLPQETTFLRRIISDKVCRATDGTKTISQQQKLFPNSIDSDFENWNLDKPGAATTDIPFDVYELYRDGNGASIFHSFERPLTGLCFSIPQIIEMVENNSDIHHPDGYGTAFLTQDEQGNFFQVFVWNDASDRKVRVYRLEDADIWDASLRRRFVVPQHVTLGL